MLRPPAFGARFRERRLAGWDPDGIVLVGVGLWLTYEWPRERLVVVPEDLPVIRLDARMLAGLEVALVTGRAELARAREIAARIGDCEATRIEIIVWDAQEAWLVDPPWERDPPAWLAPAARAALRAYQFLPMPAGLRRWWFVDVGIGARVAAALLRQHDRATTAA
jgi:hypothetical protein